MSEEMESGASGGVEDALPGTDPAAMAMALNGASQKEADAFLKNQSSLIDVQKHHLHEQFKHLRLSMWEKRMGVVLRVATAITGIAFAAGVTYLVWSAANSNLLLIDSFSIPPDMAARVTGQAVASKLLDDLSLMESQSSTIRAPQSYANNWSQADIKVDIPDTGISLGEFDRFLREKFGHDTHISGEVERMASGLSLTARAAGQNADTVAGPDTDLDKLVLSLAELVFKRAEPYRYGIYLVSHGRVDEAIAVFSNVAATGPTTERTWAYVGWSNAVAARDGLDARLRLVQQAVAIDPNFTPALSNVSGIEGVRSHPEEVLRVNRFLVKAYDSESAKANLTNANRLGGKATYATRINTSLGAFHEGTEYFSRLLASGNLRGQTAPWAEIATYQAGEHDVTAARATMAPTQLDSGVMPGITAFTSMRAMLAVDSEAKDWTGVLSQAKAMEDLFAKFPGARYFAIQATPMAAIAEARLGHFAEAEARIAPTKADCYDCLMARAKIAEMQRQHTRGDYWFERAVKEAPSIPFAYTEWGKALMWRGDFAGAVAQFKLANQKGPHFADPLEMWGEVLVAQNRSDLAIGKFTEAEKYAPNWGRLHLKWGEALSYLGKSAEAQKQFARAGALDLTAAEQTELAKVRGGV